MKLSRYFNKFQMIDWSQKTLLTVYLDQYVPTNILWSPQWTCFWFSWAKVKGHGHFLSHNVVGRGSWIHNPAIIMTTSLLALQASRSEQRYTRSSRQSFRCASCGAAAARRAANRSATRSSTRCSPPCRTSWSLPCATASYSPSPPGRPPHGGGGASEEAAKQSVCSERQEEENFQHVLRSLC